MRVPGCFGSKEYELSTLLRMHQNLGRPGYTRGKDALFTSYTRYDVIVLARFYCTSPESLNIKKRKLMPKIAIEENASFHVRIWRRKSRQLRKSNNNYRKNFIVLEAWNDISNHESFLYNLMNEDGDWRIDDSRNCLPHLLYLPYIILGLHTSQVSFRSEIDYLRFDFMRNYEEELLKRLVRTRSF